MNRSFRFVTLIALALSVLLVIPTVSVFAEDSQSITTIGGTTPTPTIDTTEATPTPTLDTIEEATPTPETLPTTGASSTIVGLILLLLVISSTIYFFTPKHKE